MRVKVNTSKPSPLMWNVWRRWKNLLGDNHPDTLTSINNLALLFKSQGKYAQAEPLNVECSAKSIELLRDYHPDTLASMNNLAGLYQNQSKYSQAEPLYYLYLAKRKEL